MPDVLGSSTRALLILLTCLLTVPAVGRHPRAAWLAAPLALLPVWLGGLPDAVVEPLLGTEGVAEAVTEGLLLAVVLRARATPLLAVGAAILLLEEWDYGQPWLGFETPAWLLALPSRSGNPNLHNLPGSGIWRLGPLAAVIAGSFATPRWWPRFDPVVRLAGPALLAAYPLAAALHASPRQTNECWELGAVVLAAAAWRRREPAPAA